MEWKRDWKKLGGIVAVFALCFCLPVGSGRFDNAVLEAFHLVKWYAREHVLLCLVPAFFIAGAIGVFVSQASVMKYLGARANKVIAYGVASVSGTILAVCSCTVLPLFAGIYRMGAGLGPACAFLYSGPAINALAIVLTARILGPQLGIARAVGAIVFSVIIGLLMHLIFRHEEAAKASLQMGMPEPEVDRPLRQNAAVFATMVGILVFANWGAPNEVQFSLRDGTTVRGAILLAPSDLTKADAAYRVKYVDGPQAGTEFEVAAAQVISKQATASVWTSVWRHKWHITTVFAVLFGVALVVWFGVPWWKVVAASAPSAVMVLLLPTHGMWVLLPFGTAVVSVAVLLNSCEGEMREWFGASWAFAQQILPLLLGGVVISGFLLGRVGHEGLIPSGWVAGLVGGNSLGANAFAAVVGAFMYFATLTEVPIIQGLIGAGMGKGPALALLLAGPALSLPNMIVIRSIMGTKKTIVFVVLVVSMATVTGVIFGAVAG